MKIPHKLFKRLFVIAITILFCQCADDELVLKESITDDVAIVASSINSPADCSSCTYVVPSNTNTQVVDGKLLGLKPGAVICLSALNKYGNITFRNIVGSASAPITITNCGGIAVMNAGDRPYNFKTENSKYFKVSGGTGSTKGIVIIGGHMGMTLEKLSTNFEVHHVEVYNTGFAGIMAKTDPTCDDATIRGNFVMKDVSFHDNYIHDTGGEAMYIGHSFYEKGINTECGYRLPHIVDGCRIFGNKIKNSGWESIQVGCALYGAYVYNNRIENYGVKNEPAQNNGIQFSEGSKGICYGNLINGGKGIGINVVGYGDTFMHDNIIINAGNFGIFCDERTEYVGLGGFRIINNTIVNPKSDGIRTYGDHVPNIILNNIVVNPGSYTTYVYPRTGNDAYVYKLSKTMAAEISNNIFTRDMSSLQFINPAGLNYRLSSTSPAVNSGASISAFNINKDYYNQFRLLGVASDIGASESF
jgi:hypothetical protein